MTAVQYHTAEQAEAALAAGAPSLVTTPGAAAFAGPAYLAEAMAQARKSHPKSRAAAWIDCGDDAGMVLRAIKAGWRHVVFAGRGPAMGRIKDICSPGQG